MEKRSPTLARPVIPMNRQVLFAFLVGGAALVAGCTSGTVDNPPTHAASSGDDGFQKQALALYTSTPFATTNDKAAHNTPEHSWLTTGDGRLTFLHWNHADPKQASGLLFTGDGVRGKFCAGEAGITKAEYDAGFVHFHTATAPNWDAGHNAGGANGAPTTDGWWLRHIGAGDISHKMMGMDMTIQKGKVFELMPAGFASLKPCEGGHGAHGEGDLNAQLLALYTSKPFSTTNDKSPHNTPEHVWLETGDGRLLFLHYNHADVTKATGLLFTGDGVRGKFCAGEAGITKAEYDAGFVHFHTATAPNWDAGHNAGGANGAPTTDGWWLRHIGAADLTHKMMGMEMKIEKGKVFELMPAGFASLQACA